LLVVIWNYLKVSLCNELRLVHVRMPSDSLQNQRQAAQVDGVATLNTPSLLFMHITVRCLFEFWMP